MKLYYAAPSPYSRKVRMALSLRGLEPSVTFVETNPANTDSPLHRANPLGKIPTLELEGGNALYDSRVICEYIDANGLSGPRLFPQGPDRWKVLTLMAMGDGIADAALLAVYEKRYRPKEMWYAPWIDKQMATIAKAVDALEAEPPAASAAANIGDVAIAAALGYLDFRLDGEWRRDCPRLVAWLEAFANQVPAFAQTAPDQP